MKLHVRTWGNGRRTALLVHGLASDSGTWEAVAPGLVQLGYRVLAPDLRGHGRSPRGYYSPQALADDLVHTLPAGADLALGHSVGAAVLTLAAQRLAAARLVYAEPYWGITAVPDPPAASRANRLMAASARQIAAQYPAWPRHAVTAEAAGRARWDPRTMTDLHTFDMPGAPPGAAVPSLVLRAGIPGVAPELDEAALRQAGFDTATVPDAGHLIHHDQLEGFLAALRTWLGRTAGADPIPI
ncbi:alpha/beta fold hydrolase [Streptomyces odontomachi]|uniref:alpha/beta fold hydrolase n=1 Tax=Streptomyces odontomachi TaxID=2944940 RepID=UPI002109C492|nr:alpha/beta hydrolase [Streptomyces sp. ODS25]